MIDSDVKCPFYKGERKSLGMSCEIGKFEFPDNTAKAEVKNQYCQGDYKKCPFCQVLERHYERKYGS